MTATRPQGFEGKPFALVSVKLSPGRAAVRALEEPAAARRIGPVAAGAKRPALATKVPHARVDRLRVLPVHRDHGAARRSVCAFEHLGPGLAAVRRLVDAALVAVAPELARSADVDVSVAVGSTRILEMRSDSFKPMLVQFSPPSVDL